MLKKQKKKSKSDVKKFIQNLALASLMLLNGCEHRASIENSYIFPYPKPQVADEFEKCGGCPYTLEWYQRLIKLSEIMEADRNEK